MFQDEARFGRMAKQRRCWAPKPCRPVMLNGYEREFVYAYGAVSPREGDLDWKICSQMNTQRMNEFLDRLIHIALPRTKDFRGIPRTAVDDMGNYTLGIKEHTIFPETSDEDLKDVFGLAITVVTTSDNKKNTTAFLEYLGFPLKREGTDGKKK